MKTRFAVAIAATVLFATLSLTASSPAVAGLMMKQVTTSDGERGAGMTMTSRIWIDTGGAKIEFLASGNPMMPAGSYLLLRPDDDGMILVNPEKKTYSTLDLAAMMQSMSAMMGPGAEGQEAMKSEVRKPVVEKLLEEDGGTILGRRTRHFRWHTQTSIAITMPMGMGMSVETDAIEDVWVADLTLDPRIMRSFENFASGIQVPKEFEQLVAAEKEKQQGMPLKRIVVSTSKSTGTGMMAMMMKQANKNADKPTRTVMDVVELSEEKIPASTFAIPAGYSETELLSPGMQMPDMNR